MPRTGGLIALATLASITGAAACSSSEPARAQLVVFVDTDLPTRGQTIADDTLSADVAIDSLRVDVLKSDGTVIDFRDFVAADPLDWPISFGVLPSEDGSPVTLRLRAFSGAIAAPGTLSGASTIEPAIETTVDRVVTLPEPVQGVSSVRVLLRGDCIGRPASFANGVLTCVDAMRLAAAPTEDVKSTSGDAPPKTVVGTWAPAKAVPCNGNPPAGTVCIPGGMTLMGDDSLDGVNGFDTSPRKLVRLSPFFMDITEVTVGRYRALLAQKKVTKIPAPAATDQNPQACTFVSAASSKNDAFPLNCLGYTDSIKACQVSGGSLPTEAQWEHAARGRGQSRRYPWGDADPSCCTLCGSKPTALVPLTECKGKLEAAGSHPATDACQGIGDQSRDGVLDLGGSLQELTADTYAPYRSACWTWQGYATDPKCTIAGDPSARGTNWTAGLDTSAGAMRLDSTSGAFSISGFRCVYPGAP